MGKLQLSLKFSLLIYWAWICCLLISLGEVKSQEEAKNPLRSSIVSRNLTRTNGKVPFRGNSRLFRRKSPLQKSQQESTNATVDGGHLPINSSEFLVESESVERVTQSPSSTEPNRIAGVDKGRVKNPEELMRNVLINHTLEHGADQDLDKLVFAALPQGKKLVFRTVRIIRTDENGDPIDEVEDAQPTYWDVTLANATASGENDPEVEDESTAEDEDSEEEVEEGEQVAASDSKNSSEIVKPGAKKKSDLESSGSHAAANYHNLNNYGGSSLEKTHGKTHYHGNNHGNTHKQTYTVTDGKDVKPFHGTEKGVTDYANAHGNEHKDQGERFKTSKRKNKGRKVSGFKRVYHKEEFQRTEHFFDDEEANKIAESFGLSESKGGANHGTKDDKRKYQGVHTEYLDGKKHENEHGTHNGYNKGHHTDYQETEKHNQHNNYGKSMSQHHGGNHQNQQYHNNHRQEEYHPNHNYHGSHSTPKKNTIQSLPASLADHILRERAKNLPSPSVAAIYSAPLATSFSVTELSNSPLLAEPTTTQDPRVEIVGDKENSPVRSVPSFTRFQNADDAGPSNSSYSGPRRRRPRKRKEYHENKMFFSPKHRPVQEDDSGRGQRENNGHKHLNNFSSYPKDPAPYQTSSSLGDLNNKEGEAEVVSPYAPNFGPTRKPGSHSIKQSGGSSGGGGVLRPSYAPARQNFRFPPKWMWPRYRQRRPRPDSTGHDRNRDHQHPRPTSISNPQLSSATPAYSIISPLNHLASIPLRHANAYNRLSNRAKYQNYFYQEHPGQISYYELSTRKSAIDDNNDDDKKKNKSLKTSDDRENDAAHYFHHNHRYAKNHLTSTIPTVPGSGVGGVRNTLLDPVPGHYSTMIKVLPAMMLPVNESTSHSDLSEFGKVKNTLQSPATLVSPTRRPLTAAESISITTEYPMMQHLMPQVGFAPSQHDQVRPFLPNKNKWLTFSFNLGNPNFKLGHEFGPSQHPFGSNSKRVSKIMHGLRHGLFRPFGRAPMMSQPTAMLPPQMVVNPMPMAHPTSFNSHRIPNAIPYQTLPHPYSTLPQAVPVQGLPMTMLNGLGGVSGPLPMGMPMGPLPLGSKTHSKTLPAPESKAKFFYDYRPGKNESDDDVSKEKAELVSRKGLYKPTLKVSSTPMMTPTTLISTTSNPFKANISSTTLSERRLEVAGEGTTATALPSNSPPFINGIMDTVADFFGKVG